MGFARKLAVAACVTASAGLGAFAASAQADAVRDGTGFGISDDGGPATLNTQWFDQLRPKAFRFMVPWYAAINPGEVSRANQIIFTARARGATNITVSFRRGEANPRSLDEYRAGVDAFIRQYAGIVDAWGPANEPNCGGGWQELNGTAGAATTADYYRVTLFIATVVDPTAAVWSPDFCDSYSAPGETANSISTWMNAYKAAGGGFGDAVAWHPYWDIQYKGAARVPGPNGTRISSTQNLINNIPTNKGIAMTEAGAFVSYPNRGISNGEAGQNDRVRWLVSTLGPHPRTARIHYYSMFGNPGGFDTGLLRGDGTRRPAWYTWCTESHGGNSFHPDCIGG